MNRILSLCLPVAVSALMLSQTSTAQAQAQDKKFNLGRNGGGGRPAAVAAPQMAAPHIASRPNVGGFAGARVTQRNFALPSQNVAASRSFAPRRTIQAPTIAHNPVLNGGRTFNHANRNMAFSHPGTPINTAAPRMQTASRPNTFQSVNRFGNTNRFNTAATPNAFATNRQFVTAGHNGSIAMNRSAFVAGNFHPGWNPGQAYYWNNHHWRCYNGVWAVVDVGWPSDWYGYPYPFAYDNVVYYGGDVYDPVDEQPAYYPAAPSAVGSSLVADVQSSLANAGYNPGPVDGDAGPQTREAIAGYQQDHGMAPTGRIDGPLLDSLGL